MPKSIINNMDTGRLGLLLSCVPANFKYIHKVKNDKVNELFLKYPLLMTFYYKNGHISQIQQAIRKDPNSIFLAKEYVTQDLMLESLKLYWHKDFYDSLKMCFNIDDDTHKQINKMKLLYNDMNGSCVVKKRIIEYALGMRDHI
ncbi:hypothetical protein PBI_SCTP2_60 [Salicola phage SCTP-2]|nr:hypothetical protein PBI_SCTP2_60 [Salicola phage SCTP-2]